MPGLKRAQDSSKPEKSNKKTKLDVKAESTSSPPTKAAKYTAKGQNDLQSSKEAHAKQKQLAKERRAAKPNADSINRAKKIWERLRRKSHVPKEEREKLVKELFGLVSGHINDFVFKHDSVRPVQCALKYATPEQRKSIAKELKGNYKTLAESRYAKFLVAKILVDGDEETREWVIGDFTGHVRHMINHPEASWILDDTYRQVASERQKAILLREWYGREFSLFKVDKSTTEVSAELSTILKDNPEKRKPILSHLYDLINQLIQKKKIGFTMLHDAMLQYSLAVGKPSENENASEFLALLRNDDDEEDDLLKNLAFTKSGARVVCRALAVGNAKERKLLLRVYKDHIEALANDPNGSSILLAAYEVVDDTVMTAKLFFPDLLGAKLPTNEDRYSSIVTQALHPVARIPLLYPFVISSPSSSKWLIPSPGVNSLIDEMRDLRSETSKKAPEKRAAELVGAMSGYDGVMLATITHRAEQLAQESFGCQFITEVLLGAEGNKADAMAAVADLAVGDPSSAVSATSEADSPAVEHIAKSAAGGRMLKTLVQAARFDPEKKELVKIDPRLGFGDVLYPRIKDHIVDWAVGGSSFVVVSMVEDEAFAFRKEITAKLAKGKARIEKASGGGNKGAAILLESLMKQ